MSFIIYAQPDDRAHDNVSVKSKQSGRTVPFPTCVLVTGDVEEISRKRRLVEGGQD